MAQAGSLRALAHELVRQYGLRYAIYVPIITALLVGLLAAYLSPNTLENNRIHEEWSPLFATGAQLIGALLIALVVEARGPFARTGDPAVRVATVSAAIMLGGAGIAAVVALSPSLAGIVYRGLLALTLGGLTGGMLALIMIGIGTALVRLAEIERTTQETLAAQGDPRAKAELARRGP